MQDNEPLLRFDSRQGISMEYQQLLMQQVSFKHTIDAIQGWEKANTV